MSSSAPPRGRRNSSSSVRQDNVRVQHSTPVEGPKAMGRRCANLLGRVQELEDDNDKLAAEKKGAAAKARALIAQAEAQADARIAQANAQAAARIAQAEAQAASAEARADDYERIILADADESVDTVRVIGCVAR